MHVLQLNVCKEEDVARALEWVKRSLKEPAEGTWPLAVPWAHALCPCVAAALPSTPHLCSEGTILHPFGGPMSSVCS